MLFQNLSGGRMGSGEGLCPFIMAFFFFFFTVLVLDVTQKEFDS